MKKNMALADRIIRLMVAAVIAVLYFTETISGILAIVLGIVAIIFTITAILNFCPLYTLLGISTRKKSVQ